MRVPSRLKQKATKCIYRFPFVILAHRAFVHRSITSVNDLSYDYSQCNLYGNQSIGYFFQKLCIFILRKNAILQSVSQPMSCTGCTVSTQVSPVFFRLWFLFRRIIAHWWTTFSMPNLLRSPVEGYPVQLYTYNYLDCCLLLDPFFKAKIKKSVDKKFDRRRLNNS